jgi:hypothetical protein
LSNLNYPVSDLKTKGRHAEVEHGFAQKSGRILYSNHSMNRRQVLANSALNRLGSRYSNRPMACKNSILRRNTG